MLSQDTKLDTVPITRHWMYYDKKMSSSKFDYNLSGIGWTTRIPTVDQVLIFQRQLAKSQTSCHYKCQNTGNHRWSWIMSKDVEWLLKHGITTIVDAPDHPGPYTGATHATKFRYKEWLGIYNKYNEHMRNSVKVLTSCFTKELLIDLETDSEVIGYTVINNQQSYQR